MFNAFLQKKGSFILVERILALTLHPLSIGEALLRSLTECYKQQQYEDLLPSGIRSEGKLNVNKQISLNRKIIITVSCSESKRCVLTNPSHMWVWLVVRSYPDDIYQYKEEFDPGSG